MYVTNKRNICQTSHLSIDNVKIEVVDCFKLLGFAKDNKLNFLKHTGNLKLAINKRIYSIEHLFYLSPKVKFQFFKSFILPHFDYWLSLIIYFPKKSIKKLMNYYNYCLSKLLKIRTSITTAEDINNFNNDLNYLNIECFQYSPTEQRNEFNQAPSTSSGTRADVINTLERCIQNVRHVQILFPKIYKSTNQRWYKAAIRSLQNQDYQQHQSTIWKFLQNLSEVRFNLKKNY